MLQNRVLSSEFEVVREELQITTTDNKSLYAQCWHSRPLPKGCIVVVHGYGSHSGRYENWAQRFAKQGYSVLSYDLRGHGKSSANPGSVLQYNKLVDDVDQVVKKANEVCPDKPVFLYGHSFGGNLVVNYVISKTPELNGIVLTSPWLELTQLPPRLKMMLAGVLGKIAPWVRSRTNIKAEDISKELRNVHQYRKDPLVHNQISVRLFREAYERGILAKRSIYKINLPLLVMHGSADKITSCQASRDFVMNAGQNTTYVEIENGYHELHNDTDADNTFNIISDWLKSKL